MEKTPLLEVSQLSVAFQMEGRDFNVIDQISFAIQPRETLALVGESGCGKSITALSLLSLLPESARILSGQIRWKGKNLLPSTEKEWRHIRGGEIGIVFQEPMTSLNPVMTVGEQISEAVHEHTRAPKSDCRKRAVEMMMKVGISDAAKRYKDYPHNLSGGMRQRVMIAMALSCGPKLLVADEPTTALDVTIQAQILDLIRDVKESEGLSLLFISHDFGVVSEVADRVAVMYAGVIVEMAPVQALFKNPRHPYTQALLATASRLSASQTPSAAARLLTIPGRVPPLGQIPSHCRFYDRCEKAEDQCRQGEPKLLELDAGHFVRCVKA